jgi:hypothetical protein
VVGTLRGGAGSTVGATANTGGEGGKMVVISALGVVVGGFVPGANVTRWGKGGATVGATGGATVGAGAGGERAARSSESLWRVDTSVSLSGVRSDPGDSCWSALTMSRAPASMRSVEDAKGMGMLEGNQVTVSVMPSRCVDQIHIVKHRYESMAGPMYHASIAWGAQDLRSAGFSCTSTLVPGGAMGVRLKS